MVDEIQDVTQLAEMPVEEVEGIVLPSFFEGNPSLADHVEKLRAIQLNHDDVILCAYPKSGGLDVAAGRADYEKRTKEYVMMEATDVDKLQTLPSPRLLNTHLFPRMLPRDVANKKIKIIHVYRNAKDVMVSGFFHVKQGFPASKLTMARMDEMFVSERCIGGRYVDYLKEMYNFRKDNPDVPVFNVSFEETKKDPVDTVRRLAEFLGVQATPGLCADIADACSFQKLKAADGSKQLPEHFAKPGRPKLNMYRKGEVGDWKNHLTVAQSERMDAALKQLDDLDYSFRYTL